MKKLIILSMVLLISLNSLFVPLGYANDDSKDKGEETTTTTGTETSTTTTSTSDTVVDHASLLEAGNEKNVVGMVKADTNLKGKVNQAIKYNEQVHYLMTYTILKGKFLENSGYAELYKSGSAATGADTGITGLNVKMGYNAVLETGTVADNPHKENTVEDGKEEEAKSEATINEAREALADKIATDMAMLYVRKYYNPTDKITPIKNKPKKAEVTLSTTNYSASSVSSLVSEKKAKELVKSMKKDDLHKLIYQAIKGKVDTQLAEGDFEGAFDDSIISHTVADKYKDTGLGIVDTEVDSVYATGFYATYVKFEFSQKYKNAKEVEHYLSMYPVKTFDETTNKNINKNFKDVFKDTVSKSKKKISESEEYKTWQSLEGNREEAEEEGKNEAIEGNIAALAWIPLDITRLTSEKNYAELIKKFDGGLDRDNLIYVHVNGGEGRRALQINDFVAIKKENDTSRKPTASPYLTYDYEKNGNTNMATATLGESSYSLGKNIGLYAGMKTVNLGTLDWITGGLKGIFGQNDYGIATPLTADEISNNSEQLYPHKYLSMLNTNQDKIATITSQADYTMGMDNYGNIISGSTLQVLIPYWHNTEVSYFKDFNTSSSYFLSTPVFQDSLSSDVAKVMKAGTSKGKPKESSNIKVDTFQVDTAQYKTFLDSVKNFKGDSIGTFPEQVQGKDTNVQGLALSIVTQTKTAVKKYNEKFVEVAFDSGELYMSSSDGGRTNSSTDGDLAEKFNAADLLERIQMILDYGFYEIIRLTIVSWVVSFYTGTVSNFSMSAVFHTQLITDSPAWKEILPSIALLLGGFVGVYIVFLGFRVVRNTLPLKGLIIQFVTLSSVIIIPLAFYAPIINLTLNKPTEWIVGKQMEQISILDNYIHTEREARETDETYALLFGSTEDIRDRSQDYVVTLYTTTHTDGFLITDVTDADLNQKNRLRSVEAMETGKWRGEDLVKVRVSIFHLFEWVEAETTEPLFNWLSQMYPKEYGSLESYEEYVTTADANIGVSDIKYTASELYKRIFDHSADVMEHIEGLYLVSTAFRNKDSELESMKITDDDREALIRDLAFSKTVRKQVYGNSAEISPSATAMWTRYGGGLEIPETDFLNLTNIVNDLVPTRDHFASNLESDLYQINREVIDNYIVNYSIVRESVGSPNAYKNAEFHIIVMDTWFKLNEVLDIHNTPTTYSPDSVTFDNYMRLVFIPMKEYSDLNNKGLENVGQFISLRSHPMALLFAFLPAIILLTIFGLTYIITFYVLMMLLIAVSFVWNYVIKNNMQNKSWLGALMIIASFSVAKIGLLVLWKVMSYVMNLSVATSSVVSYPYVLIHSLIITVYLAIALYLLFTKVFKAVLQDKSNLGGEIFSQGIDNLVSGLKSTFSGGGKGRGGKNSLRDGMGGNNAVGSSVKKAMKGEGKEGQVPTDRNPFTESRLKQLAESNGGGKNGSLAQDIDDLNFAIHNEEGVGSGHEFAVRFADTTNEVNRELAYQQGEKYDTIEEGTNGLSKDQIAYLNENEGIGTVVASTENGSNVTMLEALTENNAQILANELQKSGIRAIADGTAVAFNSTGVQLADEGVRKRIFGGILPQLLEETHKVSALAEYEGQTHNYSILEDGRVVVGVGADGLAPQTLTEMLRRQEITDNFIVEETPVKRNGEYIQGNLVLVPRRNDREATIEATEHLFEGVDSVLRAEKRVGERNEYNRQIVEFTDEELPYVYQNLQGDMQVQKLNGKNVVTYDSQDQVQAQAIHNVKSKLYRERDIKQEEQADLMHRTVAYINEGGDNGFHTETINTKDDKSLNRYALGSGIVSHANEVKMFGGEKAEAIVQRANKIKTLVQANPEALDNYAVQRDNLYRYGEQLLAGKNDNQEAVLKAVTDYAKKNNVASEKLKDITSRHEANILARKNANMTERDFVNATDALVGEMQISLQEAGVYDQFMSDVIRNAATKTKSEELKEQHTKILDDYVDSKVVLNKSDIDVTLFELYSERDFDRLSSYLESVTSVKANEDMTVTIEANNSIDTGRLKEMTELLLTQPK